MESEVRFPGTGGRGGREGKLLTERLDLGSVVVILPYCDLAHRNVVFKFSWGSIFLVFFAIMILYIVGFMGCLVNRLINFRSETDQPRALDRVCR